MRDADEPAALAFDIPLQGKKAVVEVHPPGRQRSSSASHPDYPRSNRVFQ